MGPRGRQKWCWYIAIYRQKLGIALPVSLAIGFDAVFTNKSASQTYTISKAYGKGHPQSVIFTKYITNLFKAKQILVALRVHIIVTQFSNEQ